MSQFIPSVLGWEGGAILFVKVCVSKTVVVYILHTGPNVRKCLSSGLGVGVCDLTLSTLFFLSVYRL